MAQNALVRAGLVRTYILEASATALLKEPSVALQSEHRAAQAHTFVLSDERPARLARSLQQAALLLARSPPAALFFNGFVSSAASDDVGDVQSALQIVCRDGSIISLVLSLLHLAPDVLTDSRFKAPTRAALGDLQRVYIDDQTPAGVRVRSRHFPLLAAGSTAAHCSSHLLLLGSEGARVFAAAHRARDKAKRAFFDEQALSKVDAAGIAEASSSDAQAAAATAAATPAPPKLGALCGTADSAWASVDAPDRAPLALSLNGAQSLVAMTYRQRVSLLELGVRDDSLDSGGTVTAVGSSNLVTAPVASASANGAAASRLHLQLDTCASLECGAEWTVALAAFPSTSEPCSLPEDSICVVQQRDVSTQALAPALAGLPSCHLFLYRPRCLISAPTSCYPIVFSLSHRLAP